jgi:hypothetical protein
MAQGFTTKTLSALSTSRLPTLVTPTTKHRPAPLIRHSSANSKREKFRKIQRPAYIVCIFVYNLINKTLAGVAQSVERVALMTARDKPQGRGFEPLLRLFLYQSPSWQLFFCFLVVCLRAP